MRELNLQEIESVNGAGWAEAATAAGLIGAIGGASFGSGWGTMAVGAAILSSPISVVGMVGLAVVVGYEMAC